MRVYQYLIVFCHRSVPLGPRPFAFLVFYRGLSKICCQYPLISARGLSQICLPEGYTRSVSYTFQNLLEGPPPTPTCLPILISIFQRLIPALISILLHICQRVCPRPSHNFHVFDSIFVPVMSQIPFDIFQRFVPRLAITLKYLPARMSQICRQYPLIFSRGLSETCYKYLLLSARGFAATHLS